MPNLAETFSPDGVLAERLAGFTHRQAQQDMAVLVGDLLEKGGHLAVEAGTGIGKTFAYLVPVLLSGKRAIISTGTRTLQDQLFDRDLPLLGAAVGRPVDVAVLKGRNNYLCWHRMELARHDGGLDTYLRKRLAPVTQWAKLTTSGDLTELEDLPEDDGLRGWVTSTIDNCLGAKCGHYEACFIVEARRRAQVAQVVIVNHHLLLADLSLKETGFGELLPEADVVIVDEAHQLPEVAQQFFGVSVGARELQSLARDLSAEATAAGLDRELAPAGDEIMRVTADTRSKAGERTGRLPWFQCSATLKDAVARWAGVLEPISRTLAAARDVSPGLERCWERARDVVQRLQVLESADPDSGLRWIEILPRTLTLHWTPMDSGSVLGERIRDQGGSWVFTSATLAVGEDFDHFLTRLGVADARTAVLPSPFDFERNARLYLPQGLPAPDQEDFVSRMLHEVWPLVEAAGGGAFLLFTSYRLLHQAHRWLEDHGAGALPLLVQGQGSRTELLKRFRDSHEAVLLGTNSFWQGVDVRGPALRLVAIDKLPFASPGDPLIQARLDAIRRQGGDPFMDFQLPAAVLALKQGVGRLIRDFDDRGLVVLCDPRLRTRFYGRVFMDSLPPMPVLEGREVVLEFAAGLRPAAQARRASLP